MQKSKTATAKVTNCQGVLQKMKNYIFNDSRSKPPKDVIEMIGSLSPATLRVKKVKAHDNNDGARSWANGKVDDKAYRRMLEARKHYGLS